MSDEIEKETNDGKALSDGISDQEIIETAKKRFKIAAESEAENRRDELDDLKFMIGEQWPSDIKTQRLQDMRPCLTINRIPQFVRQVTNDQRQNRPSIKVNPVDDSATIETAKIYQGIVRHIEYNSHADIAYDTGFESGAKSGLGYWALTTEYLDPLSFQQEIKIRTIKDRFSVYLDPFYQEPDGSDSLWGFIFEDMSKDEFKSQFPKAKLSGMEDWDSLGDTSLEWVKRESVRVSEYYYKIFEEEELVLILDHEGQKKSVLKSDLPNPLPKEFKILSERRTLIPKIKWCKINGIEILDRTDIPGEWIPIIPVIGEEQLIEGKRVLSGIIRHAKDPQRMYNFWASNEAETIALAPRAPFIGAAGQFEGYEQQWKSANTKNHAYLEYNTKDINGQPVPTAPQRQNFEPAVQAITQAKQFTAEELKATTGIYDASLGNKGNETSGIAIQRRNIQSQTSNFHFMDNLSRSLRHTGRILLNWIPKVYDTPQAIRIIGEDGEVDMVRINEIFNEGGQQKSHFLDVGRYDCTVDTGPSYQTKRQEAVASMIDLTKVAPQAMQMALDILVRHMDWPEAQAIADRIKKTLPPAITADEKDGQQPLPPQVQQKLTQYSQMVQGLSQEVNKLSQIIETKQVENASKERIEGLRMQNDLVLELLKHNAKDGQLAFQEEMKLLHKRLDMLGLETPLDNGNPGDPAAGPMNPSQPQPAGGVNPAAQGAMQ